MNNKKFMQLAIEEAKKAKYPFGCVIVKNGEIISVGRSGSVENDPTAHAEIVAIREACSKLDTRDLSDCTLYCTCEPCPMCFTAALWANVRSIVYGASLKDSPFAELVIDSSELNERSGSRIELQGGILREEVMEVFHDFRSR